MLCLRLLSKKKSDHVFWLRKSFGNLRRHQNPQSFQTKIKENQKHACYIFKIKLFAVQIICTSGN